MQSAAAAGVPFASRAGPGLPGASPEAPLPEGVSRRDFDQAVAELRSVVGKQWVFTDSSSALRSYRDVYATVPDAAHMPGAAVAPRDLEEIQAVLRDRKSVV